VVYIAQKVAFEVALTEVVGKENKMGVGVFFANIGAGVRDKEEAKNTSATSVRFFVPLVLPTVDNGNRPIEKPRPRRVVSEATMP
jgi:hypothetical protein